MKNKFSLILFVISVLYMPALYAQENTLDSLIQRAVSVSPEIKMLERKFDAAEDKVPQVSNLPDPMLTLGLMNLPTNSFSFTQEPMTGKVVGLSQAIPFPGKLGAMEKVTAKDADIVKQEINDQKNNVIKNVKKDYYELTFTRKAIDIAKETKLLLNNILDVVKTKYTVSQTSQQNLIKVELEITNINDKITELKGKETAQLATLNSILLLPADSQIKTDDKINPKFLDLSKIGLDSMARANRPFLKGLDIAKEKAGLMQDAAKYDYYPNFNIAFQYSFRDHIAKTNTPLDNFFSAVIGISLPLNYGGKVDAKVEEADAMENMYKEQYAASMQKLNTNFSSSVAKLNTIKDRVKLINEGLLPQAKQNLTTALASYQVGEVDFINVIDAQSKLYQIETNLYRLETDYVKEVADLEFLTGVNLSGYEIK